MENTSPELRDKCYRICSEYLGGIWKTVSKDDILIERFPDGYMNLTIKVFLPQNVKSLGKEPTQAVIKFDLGSLEGSSYRRMTENIMAVVLSENGLAPKVYGILEDGRLDEFIESRTLIAEDLANPLIIEAIAKILAQLHSQSIPITKDPKRYFDIGNMFIEGALNDPRNELGDTKRNEQLTKFKALKPKEEFIWLKKLIRSVNAPIVYCHGDFQVNNILLPSRYPNESLYIIDFDASGYNYRGIDFASLFNSFCLKMPHPEPPYFKCDWNNFPTLNVQKNFIRIYLEEFQKINNVILNMEKEESQILRENEIFIMFFYYILFIYSLFRNDGDKQLNKLDWLNFNQIVLTRYLELKNKFIDISPNDFKNI